MLLKTKAEEHPIKKLDETQTVNFEDATDDMQRSVTSAIPRDLNCFLCHDPICTKYDMGFKTLKTTQN